MTIRVSLAPNQYSDVSDSAPKNKLWVLEGENIEQLSVHSVAPTSVLALACAENIVSKGSWEECTGLIFNPNTITSTMMLANAPVSEVQGMLWDLVFRNQIPHHSNQENGVYCLWDTLDGRTFVKVSCSNSSKYMLPLQICAKIASHCEVWRPNPFLFDEVYSGKNVQPKAVSIPELFEQIAAKRLRTTLCTKLSQCVSATGPQRSKKM